MRLKWRWRVTFHIHVPFPSEMHTDREIGLYVHIPFCRQRCDFCAFYLEVARPKQMEDFSAALGREILLYREQDALEERPLRSVYFGGGTPTAMPSGRLISLLDLIRRTWPTSPTVEVTIEAHPSTITADDLRALADAGFNRISFGAESMDNHDFGPIGRPGNVRDTETAVAMARNAGFTNINLDLMYGLPGQTIESWISTLTLLLGLDPTHVSCYALTIEDGTKLADNIARRLVPPVDDAVQIAMESAAEAVLTASGFVRYEISNYAKPGSACRHNLLYWTGQDYLGLGPSAQSYVNGVRFGNRADLTAYLDLLEKHTLPVEERIALSPSEQQRDALVFGLRLIEGVPRTTVERSLVDVESRVLLSRLVTQGLLESDADRVRLTSLGQRYADTVASELF
jgi:oxygen-independent coproporphyrinogen III oxidase